jgi:hypothetical protein
MKNFLLTPQTIHSAESIASSMAKVHGRYTYSGTAAFGEGYMAPGEVTLREGKCELSLTLTNGYISSLHRVQGKNEEPNKVPNSKLQIPKT